MTPQPPPGQPPVTPGQSSNLPPRAPASLGPTGPMGPGMFPPPGMMPMMMPPPAPAAARGPGVMYAILVGLATSVFIGSLLMNVILFFVTASNASSKADPNEIETAEQTIVEGNAAERVAVIRLDGMITDASKRTFVTLLDKVARDASWRALVIEIDSPGGGVTASDEMYDAVRRFKAQREQGGHTFPVVVSMNSLAASGGYYVSMAADQIWAQETTLTGSIGVIMTRLDVSGFAEKYGIKDGSIVADGATYKNAGSPTSALTPDQEAYFKSVLNDAFATFKARINKGRPNMTKAEIEAVANGKIYSAKQALGLKLIDKIGYLDDAIASAGQLAGLAKPTAVRIERKRSTIEQLLGSSAAADVNPTSARVAAGQGGLSLSITPESVENFARPRMMYLWSGN